MRARALLPRLGRPFLVLLLSWATAGTAAAITVYEPGVAPRPPG